MRLFGKHNQPQNNNGPASHPPGGQVLKKAGITNERQLKNLLHSRQLPKNVIQTIKQHVQQGHITKSDIQILAAQFTNTPNLKTVLENELPLPVPLPAPPPAQARQSAEALLRHQLHIQPAPPPIPDKNPVTLMHKAIDATNLPPEVKDKLKNGFKVQLKKIPFTSVNQRLADIAKLTKAFTSALKNDLALVQLMNKLDNSWDRNVKRDTKIDAFAVMDQLNQATYISEADKQKISDAMNEWINRAFEDSALSLDQLESTIAEIALMVQDALQDPQALQNLLNLIQHDAPASTPLNPSFQQDNSPILSLRQLVIVPVQNPNPMADFYSDKSAETKLHALGQLIGNPAADIVDKLDGFILVKAAVFSSADAPDHRHQLARLESQLGQAIQNYAPEFQRIIQPILNSSVRIHPATIQTADPNAPITSPADIGSGDKITYNGTAYTVEKFLGAGTFGRTLQVRDDKGKAFALKLLDRTDPQWGGINLRATKDCLDEIGIQQQVQNHPNVAKVFDVAQSPSMLMIRMELIEGGSVFDLLRQHNRMTITEVAEFKQQMESALAHCHTKDVFHLDLKPANIMYTRDPKSGQKTYKLIDFGLSAQKDGIRGNALKTGRHYVGTPTFIAPEIHPGRGITGQNGVAVDSFALGATLLDAWVGLPSPSGFTRENLGKLIETYGDHAKTKIDRPRTQMGLQLKNEILRYLENDPAQRKMIA